MRHVHCRAIKVCFTRQRFVRLANFFVGVPIARDVNWPQKNRSTAVHFSNQRELRPLTFFIESDQTYPINWCA